MPKAYLDATEKYGGQTTLGPRNELQNWVAGKPFTTIDNNDPKAPVKIMYNFQDTHYFTDDLALHLVDADTGGLYIDAKGNRHYQVERHFVADWLRVMQFQGRLHHAPMPEFTNNADAVFRKSGLYPLIEPFDLKGVGGISFRYLDLLRQDDTWLYLPMLRRVRRMSSAQRSDALFGPGHRRGQLRRIRRPDSVVRLEAARREADARFAYMGKTCRPFPARRTAA
jgi:hypothetical protein